MKSTQYMNISWTSIMMMIALRAAILCPLTQIAATRPIKAVCVDIQCFFDHTPAKLLSDIGMMRSITNWWSGNTQYAQERAFDILTDLYPEINYKIVAYDPHKSTLALPAIMHQWMSHGIHNFHEECNKKLQKYAKFKDAQEKDFMLQVIHCMFNPEKLQKVFTPSRLVSDIHSGISASKPKRIEWCLIGNIDAGTYNILRQKYANELNPFNRYFLSHTLKALIQEETYWKQLTEQLGLQPEEIIVITIDKRTELLCKKLGFTVRLIDKNTARKQDFSTN